MDDLRWMDKARCVKYNPELWFRRMASEREKARNICYACPVLLECRVYSLSIRLTEGHHHLYGTWGGLTYPERRHTDTVRNLFEEAKELLAKKRERVRYG